MVRALCSACILVVIFVIHLALFAIYYCLPFFVVFIAIFVITTHECGGVMCPVMSVCLSLLCSKFSKP